MHIELRNLTKRFSSHDALSNLSLAFEPGQVVAVLGVNGAGKTTLLRCLSGIYKATSGEVLFDGEPFRRDRLDQRRRFGFLPDTPDLPDITVLRHISLLLRLYEREYVGVEERVIEALRGLDMLPFFESPLASLSRGQRYKAALAGLMAADPEVLYFDEPFAAGMDAQGMNALRMFSREAAGSRGRTIIYTTQILEIAENFSDRVLILNGGELHAFDTLANLLSAPGDSLTGLFKRLREEAYERSDIYRG